MKYNIGDEVILNNIEVGKMYGGIIANSNHKDYLSSKKVKIHSVRENTYTILNYGSNPDLEINDEFILKKCYNLKVGDIVKVRKDWRDFGNLYNEKNESDYFLNWLVRYDKIDSDKKYVITEQYSNGEILINNEGCSIPIFRELLDEDYLEAKYGESEEFKLLKNELGYDIKVGDSFRAVSSSSIFDRTKDNVYKVLEILYDKIVIEDDESYSIYSYRRFKEDFYRNINLNALDIFCRNPILVNKLGKTPPTNIYLASPFFNDEEILKVAKVCSVLRNKGLKVFSPYENQNKSLEFGTDEWRKATFNSDVNNILNANVVVAIVNGNYMDSGTAWEIGFAYAKSIPVIVVNLDKEKAVNLMISDSLHAYIDSLEDLEKYDFSKLEKIKYEDYIW